MRGKGRFRFVPEAKSTSPCPVFSPLFVPSTPAKPKPASRREINTSIEELLEQRRSDNPADYSARELELLAQYSGWGGVKDAPGHAGAGLLFEYYTPDALVRRMWDLAQAHHPEAIMSVLEPAVGTGHFLRYLPAECQHVTCYETSAVSARITRLLFGQGSYNLQVHQLSFETHFFEAPLYQRRRKDVPAGFDLVIGNPPYGPYESFHKGLGEADTKAHAWDEYFLTRGLDVLKPGGLLVMVIGAAVGNGGTLFLDRPDSAVKQAIRAKAELVDAYRNPINIFPDTDVSTEIVVLRRR